MISDAVRTDSYLFWLGVWFAPAALVGVLNDALPEAALAAVVLAAICHLYFNYPF